MQSASSVLYCHLWPVHLYHIFPHYLIHETNFGKKEVIEHKTCVWIFFSPFVWNIYLSKKKWARLFHKCVLVVLSDFNSTFSIDVRTKLKYQILWKSVQWQPFVPCGRTEGQTNRDMEKIMVAFWNFAKASNKPIIFHQGMNCNPFHFKNDGDL